MKPEEELLHIGSWCPPDKETTPGPESSAQEEFESDPALAESQSSRTESAQKQHGNVQSEAAPDLPWKAGPLYQDELNQGKIQSQQSQTDGRVQETHIPRCPALTSGTTRTAHESLSSFPMASEMTYQLSNTGHVPQAKEGVPDGTEEAVFSEPGDERGD